MVSLADSHAAFPSAGHELHAVTGFIVCRKACQAGSEGTDRCVQKQPAVPNQALVWGLTCVMYFFSMSFLYTHVVVMFESLITPSIVALGTKWLCTELFGGSSLLLYAPSPMLETS